MSNKDININENNNIDKQIFKHTQQKCIICGENSYCTLNVHRIIPGKDSGTYTKYNCTNICSNCHAKVHNGEIVIDKYYNSTKGLLLRVIINGEEKFV